MRIARRIPKATDTHSKYVKLIAFPLQQWLHELASMLGYRYITCLVNYCMKIVNISYSVRSVGTRSLDRIRRTMKVFKDTTFLR